MGTSNRAAREAQAAEAARQEAIRQSIDLINRAYSTPQRQQQYQQFGQSLLNYYTGKVKEQGAQNARNLKFSLARSGLTGGSAAVDADKQFQTDYAKGLLEASRQAQAGRASLEQADINAKNQLISLAQQGNYTGAIPTQVSQAQRAALNAAQGFGAANALGDIFAGTAQIYRNQEIAAANRRAQFSPIGSPYTSGFD